MFKNIREYDFREIVGHFVLMKCTEIVNNPKKYSYIDEEIEKIKDDIVKDTIDYYEAGDDYVDLDFFNKDSLNEEMSTRNVEELYEPVYGYIEVDKKRGYIVYLLGNDEDKLKYVYAPVFYKLSDKVLDNVKVEITDEYPYELEFKNQIKDEEESDSDVLDTRKIKDIDIYRSTYSPDFINCIVSFADAEYSAKVKLTKIQNGQLYGLYHDIEGKILDIKNGKANYLIFKPIRKIDESEALNNFIGDIITCFIQDHNATENQIKDIVGFYEEKIKDCYIKGDLPFETIEKIMEDMKS